MTGASLGSDYAAPSACGSNDGTAHLCNELAPWAGSETLSYGFAGWSAWQGRCGECYQLQFETNGYPGSNRKADIIGKNMIVQVVGPADGFGFDLLVPGGGAGMFTTCMRQWGRSDLGAQYGGFLTECLGQADCVQAKCDSVFADKPDLLAACTWFATWFGAADTPIVQFRRIACPDEIVARSGLTDPE